MIELPFIGHWKSGGEGNRREAESDSPTSFLALAHLPLVTNMTDCYSGTSI